MNKKKARQIRAGVKAGNLAITAVKAGLGPYYGMHMTNDLTELGHRAYQRTLRGELIRTARRALRAAAELKGEAS